MLFEAVAAIVRLFRRDDGWSDSGVGWSESGERGDLAGWTTPSTDWGR